MPVIRARTLCLANGAVFLLLALAATWLGTLPFDGPARETVLALASPAVLAAMRVVNYAGAWQVLIPGTVLLFLVFERARAAWWVWLVLMVAAPLAEGGLKFVVGRTRPEGLALGFPSGHATAAAAFFGAVLYLAGTLNGAARWILRALAVATIAAVAIARVMLRAHWPSDALAGIALGLALASAAALVASAWALDPAVSPRSRPAG
jgi:membrane-associated phospholipid phosphatase